MLRVLVEQLGPQIFADFENTRVIGKEQFPQQIFINPLSDHLASREPGPSAPSSPSLQGDERPGEEKDDASVIPETRVLIDADEDGEKS